MKLRFWVVFVAVFIIGVIQTTLLDYFSLLGAKPDLLLIIVIFSAIYFQEGLGLKTAIIAGLFKDITSTAIFGSNTFGFCMCALLLAHYGNYYKPRISTQVLLSGILYYAITTMVLFINYQAWDNPPINLSTYFWMMFKIAIYTGVVAPISFFILSKIFKVRLIYV